jgi:miniconductance mechanosensitive channel
MLILHQNTEGMKDYIVGWIKHFYGYSKDGVTYFDNESYNDHSIYWAGGMFVTLIAGSLILWAITRIFMLQILHVLVDHTKSTLDDHLVNNKVFRSLAHLVPLMFLEYFLSIAFYSFPEMQGTVSKLVSLLILFAVMVSLSRILNAFRDYITEKPAYADKPIQSYFQVIKIITIGILLILMLSVLTDKSPIFFLTSLGAVSAILILVFKDTILGFVGSIQLSANDMIRIGDWVTMDKYGADGDVEEINLATVKVRNFDKTITTIPTYSFISDSFKNWRGMQESEGRRIKRAIYIEVDTVHFASEELIQRLSKLNLLKEFIHERQQEIATYNEQHGFKGDELINARKQTNLGLFRRYVEYYLMHNVEINHDMTLLVRQLHPTENGVPLEIYCFTKTKEWGAYENIAADIFDHIFAIIPEFELSLFENPSGRDFQRSFKAL